MRFLVRKTPMLIDPDATLPGRDEPIVDGLHHDVLGTPLEPPFPEGTEQIQLGLGCFWGAERIFWQTPGVYTTAVGYAGGVTPNPTYEEVCSGGTNHTEAVLVVFDPAKVSLARDPAPLLGGPRPDAGPPAGERRRLAVPLRRLLDDARSSARPSRRRGRRTRRSSRRPATARSRRRSRRRGRSTTPRRTTSSTSRRTRTATAGWAGRACPVRSGSRRSAGENLARRLARRRRRSRPRRPRTAAARRCARSARCSSSSRAGVAQRGAAARVSSSSARRRTASERRRPGSRRGSSPAPPPSGRTARARALDAGAAERRPRRGEVRDQHVVNGQRPGRGPRPASQSRSSERVRLAALLEQLAEREQHRRLARCRRRR